MYTSNTWNRFLNLSSIITVAAGFTVLDASAAWQSARADKIASLQAKVIATNIPGASAIAQVGVFVGPPNAAVPPLPPPLPGQCSDPIPSKFPTYIESGAILDPNRLLVGSRSNFGAPSAIGAGKDGSFLSIDPRGATILSVPKNFAAGGGQASALGGAVQMFSANSPNWINGINNPAATTSKYTGVSNPLGLSNNNAFGRIWPANAPFGVTGAGSSTILDPTGLPLAGAPNPTLIGGVYEGKLTNRQPQVIAGSLSAGAVGTALLGPSPDGTCKAVFAVVTADGAIVQEHTVKGLDGIAPAGTVHSLLQDLQEEGVDPRMGVLMNPYNLPAGEQQLFVSEPFTNTIAVINLVIAGMAPNQVFGLGSVSRIRSPSLQMPVDLAAVQRDVDNVKWASNTTLDENSDFYVLNQSNSTIARMRQDGSVVAVRAVSIVNPYLDGALLNGITTSTDGTTIYLTFTGPGQNQNGNSQGGSGQNQGGVLAVQAF